MSFKCQVCPKNFESRKKLANHLRRHNSSFFECADCQTRFTRKDSLRGHIVHRKSVCQKKKSPAVKSNVYCFKCYSCGYVFSSKENIINHYEEAHKIELETESLNFASYAEFQEWKFNVEFQCIIQFSSRSVWKTSTATNRLFICHRSGYKTIKSDKLKRFPRFNGSKKIDAFCPAAMSVKINDEDGFCTVNYIKTHVGHSVGNCDDLCYFNLVRSNATESAQEAEMSIPRNKIIKSDGKSPYLSDLVELSVSEYANNVASLSGENYPREDDGLNLVEFVVAHKDDILYLKDETEDDVVFNVLRRSDFMLVFMNAWQEKNLKRFGHKVVAFDSTHSPTKYHLAFHTLLVYNVDRKGVPVAFLITNRNDQDVITIFLQCIRDRVGDIRPNTILSDALSSYFDSWSAVMEHDPDFRLYCIWHVHATWRRNLSKINDAYKRMAVYNQLLDLSQELSAVRFEEKLSAFLSIDDQNVEKFMTYFRETYLPNTPCWAYCFRKNAGVNVNMALEAFHRKLKYDEADSRISWLSHALRCLHNYVQSRCTDEKSIRIRGRACHKLQMLRKNHHVADRFLMQNPNVVVEIGNGEWLVNSFVQQEIVHSVSKILEPKECSLYDDVICGLPCHLCDACFHEYTCDCVDASIRGNMCEHIHSVCIFLKNNGNAAIPVVPTNWIIPNVPTDSCSPDISVMSVNNYDGIRNIKLENQARE